MDPSITCKKYNHCMDSNHYNKISKNSKKVMETISSQHITGRCNRIHVIASCRDDNILRNKLKYNRSIFNQMIHIQEIGVK